MAAKSEVSAFRNVRKAATARERCPERPSAEAVRLSRNCGAMRSSRPTGDGWSFPLGTNFESFTSFWYFVDGRIRPTPPSTSWWRIRNRRCRTEKGKPARPMCHWFANDCGDVRLRCGRNRVRLAQPQSPSPHPKKRRVPYLRRRERPSRKRGGRFLCRVFAVGDCPGRWIAI